MVISCAKIEQELRNDFSTRYRRFSSFVDNGDLWDRIIDTVRDVELMKNIVFCNDVMKIPPVKTFIMAQKTPLKDLENDEKQAIGAFFGFIFKDVFKYTGQESVSCVVNTVKTATRFCEPKDKLIIGDE